MYIWTGDTSQEPAVGGSLTPVKLSPFARRSSTGQRVANEMTKFRLELDLENSSSPSSPTNLTGRHVMIAELACLTFHQCQGHPSGWCNLYMLSVLLDPNALVVFMSNNLTDCEVVRHVMCDVWCSYEVLYCPLMRHCWVCQPAILTESRCE